MVTLGLEWAGLEVSSLTTTKPINKTTKEKVVHESILGMVIAGQHSSLRSLHYPKREVYIARLPASRGALLSNTHDAHPSGYTSMVTPGLEWAGHLHVANGPYPDTSHPHPLAPAWVTGSHYTTRLTIPHCKWDYNAALHIMVQPIWVLYHGQICCMGYLA